MTCSDGPLAMVFCTGVTNIKPILNRNIGTIRGRRILGFIGFSLSERWVVLNEHETLELLARLTFVPDNHPSRNVRAVNWHVNAEGHLFTRLLD